jgi:hypothetical protein
MIETSPGDRIMTKFFATLLGALIGAAMFAAVGVGMAHARPLDTNAPCGAVAKGAADR